MPKRPQQKGKVIIQEQKHKTVDGQCNKRNHPKGSPDTAPQAFFLFFPKINRKYRTASHTESDDNGIQKCHQCIGRAYCRQRMGSQKSAYDQCICYVITLLQQIPQDHGACK